MADELAVLCIENKRCPGVEIARQDLLCDERFGSTLQIPFQRTRTIDRIVAVVDDNLLCRIRDLKTKSAACRSVCHTCAQPFDEVVNDAGQIFLCQRLEEDDFIETVQKFRTEGRAQIRMTFARASSLISPSSVIPSSRY